MVDMKEKKYILIPVDFSPHSEAALLLGCKMATCFNARPLALHVVHDPGEMPGYYAKTLKKKVVHRIEDVATQMLDDFIADMSKTHAAAKAMGKLEALLVKGLPANRIMEVAEKYDVSMIVMGSKGRTGLKHLLLGSVAERVVQMSSIPVTVAKIHKK